MKSRRVLITGVSGFTGRHLRAHLLSNDFEVFGISADTRNKFDNSTSVNIENKSEVREYLRATRPNHVIHLAAKAFIGAQQSMNYHDTNVQGTRNLLESLLEESIPINSISIASSANVYGNQISEILTEDSATNPANPYAESKVAMEIMASEFFSSLPITILRPFNYTGLGQSSTYIIPKLVEAFKNEATSLKLGNVRVSRDFSDVRDLCHVYQHLISEPSPGEFINFCSGKSYAVEDVIKILQRISKKTIRWQVDESLIRKNELLSLQGNTTKLMKTVGPFPRIPLEETLEWMYFGKPS